MKEGIKMIQPRKFGYIFVSTAVDGIISRDDYFWVCNSVKAAKRRVKKADVPKGTKFILYAKYQGMKDIFLTKK